MSVYIIAEIGCNHNGDPAIARSMVDAAAECGADAVKFQTFKADALISRFAPKAEYQKATTGEGGTQLEMTRKLELPGKDLLALQEHARSLGLDSFSTAFDLESAEFLADHGQRVWKIPSGEVTNLPLLRYVGALDTPDKRVILSTGMSTIDEVGACLDVLSTGGTLSSAITLLHCNTEYPTPDGDVNLTAIAALKRAFPGIAVGFSDHSVGWVAAAGAVALGASVVEKHFTLSKLLPGPDHRASATPEELAELCHAVRKMESMLGCGEKVVTESEAKNKIVARKSIVAAQAIEAGEKFTEENIACKRPGNGISPMLWDELLGKRAERAFEPDELIEMEGLSWQG